MSGISEEGLRMLSEDLATVNERSQHLIGRFVSRPFKNEEAREYANHGVARRLQTIVRCIERVFEILPPEDDTIPEKDDLTDAVIYIQAVMFNVYGLIDNLAMIWVRETGLRKSQEKELPKEVIGLMSKCKEVRSSFPGWMQDHIKEFDEWFDYLSDYRNSLGHRIPLFVPPYSIDPDDLERYREIENEKLAAVKAGRMDIYDRLMGEERSLGFFRPYIAHSLEGSQAIILHPQLLTDFMTIELLCSSMLKVLNEVAPSEMQVKSLT